MCFNCSTPQNEVRLRKARIKGGDVLFLPALNFLFLLGLIDYHPKTDSVDISAPNEAVEALLEQTRDFRAD